MQKMNMQLHEQQRRGPVSFQHSSACPYRFSQQSHKSAPTDVLSPFTIPWVFRESSLWWAGGRITPGLAPPGEPEQALEEKPGSPLSNRRWVCISVASTARVDQQLARVEARGAP